MHTQHDVCIQMEPKPNNDVKNIGYSILSFLYRGRLYNFVDNVIDSDSVDGKEHLHTIKKYFFLDEETKNGTKPKNIVASKI